MSENTDRPAPAPQADQQSSQMQVRKFAPHYSRFRRKVCKFCTRQIAEISYKDMDKLLRFTTERGKIMPRRLSGNCAKHQRMLTREIKIARLLALMPFVRE
jgi:small subunit ribosomal protein S18